MSAIPAINRLQFWYVFAVAIAILLGGAVVRIYLINAKWPFYCSMGLAGLALFNMIDQRILNLALPRHAIIGFVVPIWNVLLPCLLVAAPPGFASGRLLRDTRWAEAGILASTLAGYAIVLMSYPKHSLIVLALPLFNIILLSVVIWTPTTYANRKGFRAAVLGVALITVIHCAYYLYAEVHEDYLSDSGLYGW